MSSPFHCVGVVEYVLIVCSGDWKYPDHTTHLPSLRRQMKISETKQVSLVVTIAPLVLVLHLIRIRVHIHTMSIVLLGAYQPKEYYPNQFPAALAL